MKKILAAPLDQLSHTNQLYGLRIYHGFSLLKGFVFTVRQFDCSDLQLIAILILLHPSMSPW